MFENPRRGRQVRNFTTNVPKILDLKSSSEQIFSRKLSLGAPVCKEHREPESINNLQFTLAEFACSNSLASSRQNAGSSWESWLQNPMKFYQHGGNLWLRTRKQKQCVTQITLSCLCFMLGLLGTDYFIWGSGWVNAKKISCTAFAEEKKIVHSSTKQRNTLQPSEIKFMRRSPKLLVTKRYFCRKKLPTPHPQSKI